MDRGYDSGDTPLREGHGRRCEGMQRWAGGTQWNAVGLCRDAAGGCSREAAGVGCSGRMEDVVG